MNFLRKNKPKIFCIGQNKTGTTSLESFFKDHGFKVGNQRKAELLIDAYIKRDWQPILTYCKTAQVFQDIPFSNDYLYILLDHYFPNAKFILTERTTSEDWYNSITKFHSKLFGKDGRIPTKDDLQNGTYIYKGFIWKSFYEKYGETVNDIYNKEKLIDAYEVRNKGIRNYFKNKNNLLILDVAETDSVIKLADFIGATPKYSTFPWENKTNELK
ncbi:sulfotransferase [Winogradskyella bathintestinalis]|uniref:Sulfotransferase n=1 Tax=Winogradskyella bathintestinalis TaxID=3035208 RepID=A0ABT7ZTV5_9FLAO|nr:sulfotransferase [Winogradskyella bathintestinalis]MDN3492438.1 sulfotransferase [Winogradskyella bathintestinalis]